MKRYFGDGNGFLTSWQLVGAAFFNFVIFYIFLYKPDWGMGVTLFELAHLAPVFATTHNKNKLFYTKIALAILLSFFMWMRADFLIRFLSLGTIIGLDMVIFQEARSGQLIDTFFIFNLPFICLEKLFYYTQHFLKFLVSWQSKLERFKRINESETIKRIIVGILLGMPVIFILIALFSSADQNFQNIFVGFFQSLKMFVHLDWLKNIDWIWTFVLRFGIFWIYLCMAFPYENTRARGEIVLGGRIIEKMTVGVLVAGVFAIFIVTQFKSFSFILDGFTTGQINPGAYVREGFFQLLIACFVGLSIFYILKKDVAKSFLTLFLLGEVFLVSLIAGERVYLYQYQYGLTQARVWGIFSLLFLISVIVTLFLNLKNKVGEKNTWQIYILSFAGLLICVGTVNVDNLIATVRPPVVDGRIDVRYMANNLSWDGAGLWINGLKDMKTGDLEYKYNLAKYAPWYLAELENNGDVPYLDAGKVCSQKPKDWLNENIAVSVNRKQFCDSYPAWMTFKLNYEKEHNIVPDIDQPNVRP